MNLSIKTSKNWVLVIGCSLVFSSLFTLSIAQAQSACKVLDEDISANYTGGCINGFADGDGTASGKNEYTGQFKAGMKHGKGLYKYKSTNTSYVYAVEVVDINSGAKRFKLIELAGGQVEGDFINDKLNGIAIIKYASGSSFEGNYVNGVLLSARGTLSLAKSDINFNSTDSRGEWLGELYVYLGNV